jgi:hypothetical protein
MKKQVLSVFACFLIISTSMQVLAHFGSQNNDITTEENLWNVTFEKKIEQSSEELPSESASSDVFNNETYVKITRPKAGYLYLFDKEIFNIGFTLVIGPITIEVETDINTTGVDFYIDNNLKFSDDSVPYSRVWNEQAFGRRSIKAAGQNVEAEDELSFFILNLHTEKKHVVINEVMPNPLDADGGNEWIELYNPGNAISIDGWTVCNSEKNIIATLPNWLMPSNSYLLVNFGNGANEDDFSDGKATFFAGKNQEMFDNDCDECALYSGQPNQNNIIDFISFCNDCDCSYTPGSAHDDAVAALIWHKDECFSSIDSWSYGRRLLFIDEGDSIGRDSYSTDHDLPSDWEARGGKDAFQPTPGQCNIDAFGIFDMDLPLQSNSFTENKKNWTVMVYMADCNLENDFWRQLNELERVGTNDKMNIIFQIDGFNKTGEVYVDSNGDLKRKNNKSAFRGFLLKDNRTDNVSWNTSGQKINSSAGSFIWAYNPPGVDACIGEINTGSSEPLTSFIHYANDYAPADRYILILGGHGAGWKGLMVDQNNNVTPDNSHDDDWLYMDELHDAFQNSQWANPLTPGKFAIIGFDLCHMAMIEVAYQIYTWTDYIVASEELDSGWDYEDIFNHLQNNIDISSEDLSKYMVDSYDNTYWSDDCRTLSAIKTSAIPALNSAIDTFANNLKTGMEDWGDDETTPFKENGQSWDNCQIDVRNTLIYHYVEYYAGDRNFKDLYDFAKRIGDNNGIFNDYKAGYQDVKDCVDQAVVHEIHGIDHSDSHGISIYFPRDQFDARPYFKCGLRYDELPFDWPDPSRLGGPTDPYALYAEDFTIEWGKVPYVGNPPHPWKQLQLFFFPMNNRWDEFLHRFYKPCADAGVDQSFEVDDCSDTVNVQFNGWGSSSADDDYRIHKYIWDFNDEVNSDFNDWDRDGLNESNDDNNAEGPTPSQVFGVGEYTVTLTVWDDHHTRNDSEHYPRFVTPDPFLIPPLTNDFPNEHWKTDQDQCVITVTCDEDETPPTVTILTPADGDYVTNPVEFTGEATDSGSGIVELDFLLEWPGNSYSGDPLLIDPPKTIAYFSLGPFNFNPNVEYYKMTIYAKDASDNVGSDSVVVYPEVENQDTTPPITTAAFDPELRIVTLTAIDPPHGDDPVSGVCATYYFIDEGDTVEYFEPFLLPEGTHAVSFWSVDCANNVEEVNTEIFG